MAENSKNPLQEEDTMAVSKEDVTVIDKLQNLAEESLDGLEEAICGHVAPKGKYLPGPLSKEGKAFAVIKDSLLSVIADAESQDAKESVISCIRPQRHINSETQKAALLSQTISAYIKSLNTDVIHNLSVQLMSDTSLWLGKIFRFFDSMSSFDKDHIDGLIRVIRMVLHLKYVRYSTTGYEALFTRPPVIYYCDSKGHNIGKSVVYLCSQLGLPLSCMSAIPCVTGNEDDRFKMDVVALEKSVKDDLSAAKTPLLVIANAGSALFGTVDSLQKIQEICTNNNVWLHVHGHNLAALCLNSVPSLPSNLGDSMTLTLSDWLGLPSLPCVTLCKIKEMSHMLAAFSQSAHGSLEFLPVWFSVQTLGSDVLVQKIRHCFELAELLNHHVSKFPELRILSRKKSVSKDGNQPGVPSIGEKSIPTSVLLESATSVIVFQYFLQDDGPSEKCLSYFDNLNSWFVQLMARQIPTVKTELLVTEEFGVCLRVCPLEFAHTLGTTKTDVEQYFICLQQQVEILNSTVHQKIRLVEECKKHQKLQLVEISNWAGMGGVRYIPDFWVGRLNELTDTGKEDINQLNSDLVAKLKLSDSAFSLGEADDTMLCVRFGMVDADLNLDELMSLVTEAGQQVEESSKFLETMSEMIKSGIQEANKELIQENKEKLMQEGVLRQVPVIGSLVSWMYPSQSEAGIKGRRFDLSSGTVESTESIYKYHMQIKETSKTSADSSKVTSRSSSRNPSGDIGPKPLLPSP